MKGSGTSRAISTQAPSLAVEPVEGAVPSGSLANRPSSAVARLPTSVTTVPDPAEPRVMPCCDSTPVIVTTAISSPAADVFGWFQMFEIDVIAKAPSTSK